MAQFRSRTEAGQRLAGTVAALVADHPEMDDLLVLALPRGGVPVAAEVAHALGAPMDLVFVRKIGAPMQPELAAAAVVDGDPPIMVTNDEVIRGARIDPSVLAEGKSEALKEIARRRQVYLCGRPPLPVAGRDAIIVDDGVATGATTLTAIRATAARRPRSLTLAVPVAPADSLARLRPEVDHVVCLSTPRPFFGVGAHFADFHQLEDEEVRRLMEAARVQTR